MSVPIDKRRPARFKMELERVLGKILDNFVFRGNGMGDHGWNSGSIIIPNIVPASQRSFLQFHSGR
jgi:hypothetical protein